jgi:hypothetical protein
MQAKHSSLFHLLDAVGTVAVFSPSLRLVQPPQVLINLLQTMRFPYISRLLVCIASIAAGRYSPANDSHSQPPGIFWRGDYHEALDAAKEDRKLALIWFYDRQNPSQAAQFEHDVLSQPAIAKMVEDGFVAIRLPTDARVPSGGHEVALLEHPAFGEMQGAPGIALLDMSDEAGPHFRQVVSVYPFQRRPITEKELAIMLELPKGTLTQRTLIFAVRTHAEQPASAASEFSPLLARETENHAAHQAQIKLQGHHQWASRFQSINAQLPPGLVAQEVCAESWPGQNLVEAAEECVDSWRHSAGHWDAVSRRHVLFGYDMKRGANGVWYAAGIFARKM